MASLHGCGWCLPKNAMLNTGKFSLKVNQFQGWGRVLRQTYRWAQATNVPNWKVTQHCAFYSIPMLTQSRPQSPLFPGCFSFVQHDEHGLWPLSRQEVRKSRTSDSSTHAQKFETTVVVNGYKTGPSLRLRINWRWARVRVLGADKKKSWLWGRDWCLQWRDILTFFHSFVFSLSFCWEVSWVFVCGSSFFKP